MLSPSPGGGGVAGLCSESAAAVAASFLAAAFVAAPSALRALTESKLEGAEGRGRGASLLSLLGLLAGPLRRLEGLEVGPGPGEGRSTCLLAASVAVAALVDTLVAAA